MKEQSIHVLVLDSTPLHSPPHSFWRVFQGQTIRNAHYLICMYNVNMHIFICSLHLQGICWHQDCHVVPQQNFLLKGAWHGCLNCHTCVPCGWIKEIHSTCPLAYAMLGFWPLDLAKKSWIGLLPECSYGVELSESLIFLFMVWGEKEFVFIYLFW